MSSAKQKAIIIGSGVAGKACAIRLASQNFEVTVFEKNNHAGGKLYVLEQNGFRFDTGPSLFVQPENFEDLFTLADENINDYLRYKPIDITCKYFYEDGIIINAFGDKEKFAKELNATTNEPLQHTQSYLNRAAKIYNDVGKIFLNNSLHQTKTWINKNIFKAFGTAKPSHIFSSLNKANTKSFSNKHTVQLFNRYATYSGSNPYKAPAMLQLVSHIEFNEGVYYPEGGMISLNKALYNLALKKGVAFKFDSPVQKIINTNNIAKGVTAGNENFYADVIVSNVDAYFTYKNLLNDDNEASKILQQERSSSALIFYWGISREFPQLELHNILFSNNYKEEFKSIFKTKQVYDDPTIYINITSKVEPGIHAQPGKENWFVMVNVASDKSMSNEHIIHQYKKNIIAKLNRMLQTNVEPLIETEAILHPQKIEEDTASYAGALYGTSSNSRKAAFLRHPNFSKKIKRLYFAGGSVHPGGGIPLCLKSAQITSDIIMNDSKKWKMHE